MASDTTPNSPNLSDRQEETDAALGYMVRNAAMVEFFLDQTIRRLIQNPYTPLVTASLSASGSLDVIKRIVEAGPFSDEAAQEMAAIIGRCRAAFPQRNQHVHGLRVIGDERDATWTKNRRTGSLNQTFFEVDELRDLGREFSQIASLILGWSGYYLEGKSRPGRRETQNRESEN
ncbi:hypothetical protein [Sphaerisporangium krabiense]|uniref:Uncharacterized protein n=1 Tax=Sphaerisporangium krabiense TaxID=763782 RepID=A0A7W9DQA4_9ACTN|nr:hypothetical protein [Sphaerisporangium krabiense]MBB5626829.1 hypothetical protein [Sphaerisporangium krabiense]